MRTITIIISMFALFPQLSLGQIAVVGELSHDRQAQPGETYEGSILVRNDSPKPQEAKVYSTDYAFSADGANNYAEAGTLPRSNAKWIEFSPSHLMLSPNGQAEVSFRVTIPRDTSDNFHGSYWSMIMIEGIPEGSPESSLQPAETRMGILQTIRYGIQIASHVGTSGIKDIRLEDAKLLKEPDGGHFLQLDIKNVGTRGMRPEVYVELFTEEGIANGKYHGIRYRIYPGTSVREKIVFPDVPKGSYKAMVVIDDGGNDIFGAQYTLEF